MTFNFQNFGSRGFGTKATGGAGFDDDEPAVARAIKDVNDALDARDNEMRGFGREVQARLLELEQKVARRGGGIGGGTDVKSAGEAVIASPEFKAFKDGGGVGRARISIATKSVTLTSSLTGGMIAPDIRQPIVLPRRRLTVRGLLNQGRTNSNLIELPRQNSRVNNAAPVAETALKPQTDLGFEMVNSPVRTIAHWILTSVQALDDAPVLASIIDSELRFGLAIAEETELLLGDGTGVHLLGLMAQTTAYDMARETGITAINKMDRLGAAIGQLEDDGAFEASGIVMNSRDWASIRSVKDSQGRYILGSPAEELQPMLWNLPVAATPAMPQGSWLVGDFNMAAQIFDRQDATVELSTEDSDNFRKNLVTVRAEERLAMAVRYPSALISGNFTFS